MEISPMIQLKPFSLLLLAAALVSGFAGSATQAVGQTVRFDTNVGEVIVQLHPDDAPLAVANFLTYANAPAGSNYDGTFFHRSVANFIVQGGGFFLPVDGIADSVPALPPIQNEFGISNTRGTLAFAKLGGDPDSATNQWFFNTADNSANLDVQNGGFTVFGTVISGLDVVDEIQALQTFFLGAGPFGEVPLIDAVDFVALNSVREVLQGDVDLNEGVTFEDIAPFIQLLTDGEYQAEADIDQNGAVDFADIAPFIEVLTGQ